ncbi:putative PPE family protein PPE29 [Mycobacterium kiyosense]|jgi:hypothetical protein|nr:putative PPE family protein PPE29 [Mycobacterium kiyosense]
MDFGLIPPEINSNRMFHGPGSEPLLAAAAAWDALGNALYSAEISLISVLSGLGNEAWHGPSATSMAQAVRTHLTWIAQAVVCAHHTAAQARSTVAAYETALARTVLPPTITANRNRLRSLAAANQLARYTPAIAAVEANYSEMWARDAAAMYDYARSAAMTTRLTPFPVPDFEVIAAGTGERGDTLPLTRSGSDTRLYCTVPRALTQLATRTPQSSDPPRPVADSHDDPADSSFCEPTSAMSAAFALISGLVTSHDERGGTVGRLQSVSVQAWFGGCPTPINRDATAGGGRAVPAMRPVVGPAAAVGDLSVPQAWVDRASPRPAPIVPTLASRFTSPPDRKP